MKRLSRLPSRDDHNVISLQDQLKIMQTQYSTHFKERNNIHQPHVSTIFSKSESKPKKSAREFHVVETENPHVRSVIRVRPLSDQSSVFSVRTETTV